LVRKKYRIIVIDYLAAPTQPEALNPNGNTLTWRLLS